MRSLLFYTHTLAVACPGIGSISMGAALAMATYPWGLPWPYLLHALALAVCLWGAALALAACPWAIALALAANPCIYRLDSSYTWCNFR